MNCLPSIAAIILTKNEARHIERCIASLQGRCRAVIVVDSGSTDGTVALARATGAQIHVHPWINHAAQFNHGLTLLPDDCDWVLRIDADEILASEWPQRVADVLARRPATSGIAFRRYIRFRGRTIRWGGAATWQLRLFRRGHGRCEQRWMDEHISVSGPVAHLPVALIDDNLNDTRWWAEKHLAYADREAVEIVLADGRQNGDSTGLLPQARLKRFIKNNIYSAMPTALRATLYFLFRYFILLGFLDGLRGFQFHFLQGWWYRLYADIRVEEIRGLRQRERLGLEDAIRRVTGLEIGQRGG